MKRRSFFGALLGLPFIMRKPPVRRVETRWIKVPSAMCPPILSYRTFQPVLTVTNVNHQTGTITVEASRDGRAWSRVDTRPTASTWDMDCEWIG